MKKNLLQGELAVDVLVILHSESELLHDTVQALLPEDIVQPVRQPFVLGDFAGKKDQQITLYTGNANVPRVIIVGVGAEPSVRTIKQAVGRGIIAAQGNKAKNIGLLIIDSLINMPAKELGQILSTSADVAAYAFDQYKNSEHKVIAIESLAILTNIIGSAKRVFAAGIERGSAIAEGVNLTRTLGNIPPHDMTPTFLAKQAQVLAKKESVNVTVLEKADMKKLGMGCLLGVASGSEQPPKFIIVEYNGGKKTEKPTVLVGKGITFDSGGLSLKPDPHMCDMKYDMLGAATVLGTLKAAVTLGIKKNIIGVIPSCENMPGGSSYRPDDILRAMNGKTVEIKNTDAEGRLILADALSYVTEKMNPKQVIDLATLTGACMIALGNERSGLFSPNSDLARDLYYAAEGAREQLWRLPLGEEYTEGVQSDVADVKNIGTVGGSNRLGGASTAAAFLQEFTKNTDGKTPYPWAHIDLSCSYYGGKGKAHIRHGANGFGVETLIAHLS